MIRNVTRKKILAEQNAIMDSYLQKNIGFMFQSKVEKGLIFPFKKPRRMGIHMMFVFTPIDILFLDDREKIVEMMEKLQPFGFYLSKNKAKTFIELAPNTIKKTGTKIGDKIKF